MAESFARRVVGLGVLIVLALASPAGAFATVEGGCTAEGHSSGGSSVDITTADVWHLSSNDVVAGSGEAPTPMSSATVGAYALGILIPIASAPSPGKEPNPQTAGSIDGVSISTLAVLGKVFVVGAKASGDGGSCDGQILVILDDVDALFTILGGGGLAAAVVGLAIMLASSRGQGCLTKILGTFGGGLAGVGLALAGEQFQIFEPTTYIGTAIVIIGALLGLIVAGRLAKPPAGTTPAASISARPLAPPPSAPAPTAPLPPPPAPTPPPPPAAVPPATPPATSDTGQDFPAFMERAETGDPETASFLEEVGGPGVVSPAGSPPPPAATPPEPPAPAPAEGPANEGESHPAEADGPDNRPVGGGGPM